MRIADLIVGLVIGFFLASSVQGCLHPAHGPCPPPKDDAAKELLLDAGYNGPAAVDTATVFDAVIDGESITTVVLCSPAGTDCVFYFEGPKERT